MCTKSLQWCLTLCNPMDCNPTAFSCPWDSPGKNTGVGCHFLLQGNFLTQGSNPGLPHCRQTLYRLSHKKSHLQTDVGLPLWLSGKESACIAGAIGDADLIPGPGRSAGREHGNPP